MVSVKKWFGKGISPQAFMEWMSKNQETFKSNYEGVEISEEDKQVLTSINKNGIRCLVIASDWCGDVVRNAPVIFKLMEVAGIPTEVFILEENDELINHFLLYGGKSIPVVLLANEEGEVVNRWGPRPDYIQAPMAAFKALDLDRESEEYKEKVKDVYDEIHKRYGEGTGYHKYIIDEYKGILSHL